MMRQDEGMNKNREHLTEVYIQGKVSQTRLVDETRQDQVVVVDN